MDFYNKDTIYVACDGACSGNGGDESPGGWGAVLHFNGHEKELNGGNPKTTNNVMELTACVEALQSIKPDAENFRVVVYCDSAYIVNCFHQKWYVKWEKNGWMSSTKEPVKNPELWKALLTQYRRFRNIAIIKIKGHITETEAEKWCKKNNEQYKQKTSLNEFLFAMKLNNRADALAVAASQEAKKGNSKQS